MFRDEPWYIQLSWHTMLWVVNRFTCTIGTALEISCHGAWTGQEQYILLSFQDSLPLKIELYSCYEILIMIWAVIHGLYAWTVCMTVIHGLYAWTSSSAHDFKHAEKSRFRTTSKVPRMFMLCPGLLLHPILKSQFSSEACFCVNSMVWNLLSRVDVLMMPYPKDGFLMPLQVCKIKFFLLCLLYYMALDWQYVFFFLSMISASTCVHGIFSDFEWFLLQSLILQGQENCDLCQVQAGIVIPSNKGLDHCEAKLSRKIHRTVKLVKPLSCACCEAWHKYLVWAFPSITV